MEEIIRKLKALAERVRARIDWKAVTLALIGVSLAMALVYAYRFMKAMGL